MKTPIAVALVVALASSLVLATAQGATADETTGAVDNLRTGWDSREPGLSAASVQASDFGQLFSTQLDGQIYSQPLSVGGTVIAATENNKGYGLNPVTGATRWTRDFGPAWPASALNCADLAPNIGSTSTPVYDPATNAVYLTTKVNDGATTRNPHWYMHALNPATGAEKAGWPVTIAGSPSNDPTAPFDPYYQQQRPGLLLLGGVVYAAFGAHCDRKPYRGYVVGVSTSAHALTAMWASETGASNQGAGIWQSGGGLVSDGAGRIFLSTGNGISPPPGPGATPPGTLSESVVRLQVGADGSLSAADFFSPSNAPTMDLNDTDLSSGAPVGLPAGFGTASHPSLLVQQGKDGRVFLLDRDNLGGRSQGAGGTDAVVGVTGPYQGQWGRPAVWGGDGGYVYVTGSGGPLRALKYGVTGAGLPALSLSGTSRDKFPYTSGSPVVTSDGTTSGSALVWVMWAGGSTGTNATLRAYRAVPDGTGILPLVWSAPIGTAAKFATPATDGGRVYVGTRDGKLLAFGRPAKTAMTGTPVEFGNVAVGATGTGTAVVTANQAVTITAIGTTAPFGATPPALPVNLTAGQTLRIPVSFSPTAVGGAADVLTVTANTGTFALSLHGNGTQAGLTAAPSTLAFGSKPTGTTATLNVQVTNSGTATETVSATTPPTAPFTAAGLPAAGTTVAPGGSFIVSVTYAPTAAQNDSSSFTVTSTSGTLTVPLTGSAVTGQGHLQLTPTTLDFGSVGMGTARTQSFDITNTGNIPVTITKAKAPSGDFSTTTPLSEGLVIGPGAVVHQAVIFSPSVLGPQTASYDLTGDDGQGPLSEPLTGTGASAGTGGTVLPTPAAATWSANGTATLPGNATILLNGQTTNAAGSSFYRQAVPSEGLQADFTAQFGPGTGADGLTFALLDASKAAPTGLGVRGGGLGFSGLPGVAVGFATYNQNVVGIIVGPNSGTDTITWTTRVPVPTSLRTGTHKVGVSVVGGHVKVTVDGTQLVDAMPPLPANVYPGFTSGTGTKADAHSVSAVAIRSGGTPAAQPLTATPASLDFGSVPVGGSKQLTVALKNTGTQPQTINSSAAPVAPFTATLPAAGTVVPAGGTVNVSAVFAPTVAGARASSLAVTTASGTVTVQLTGTGGSVAPAGKPIPGPTDPSWVRNGAATLSGTDLLLTKAGGGPGAGSSFYPLAVPVKGLHASFTAVLGGGTGGDGLTLALLDPASATPNSLGGAGSGLGFTGLAGVAVALDTVKNGTEPSANFVGIASSTVTSTGNVPYRTTSTAVPALRTGSHLVTVDYTTAGHLVVSIDGTRIFDVAGTLPPNVLVGFTAGQSTTDDNHIIRGVSITAGQ